MSEGHGGIVTAKPIGEIAKYIRNIVPANIPDEYALNPILKNIAGEENIRMGIVSFRDFIYLFCDRLTSDGYLYAKPPKKPGSVDDYPFLHNISNVLAEIGYYSKLSEKGNSLRISELPSFSNTTDDKGKVRKAKIPASGQAECLKFLALCGFVFSGIDLEAKALNFSEAQAIELSYPKDPLLLTGLKAMSIADMELRETRRYWNDHYILRCNYRLVKAEKTDPLDELKDFVHPLPSRLQKFAINLHRRYTDIGMSCVVLSDRQYHFAYYYRKNSRRPLSPRDLYTQRVWEFSLSLRHGYCLYVRAKKTEKYKDIIKKFPANLREIIERGYGCDRKLRNERCQGGCQGIRIPLDDSILNISKEIQTWLDCESESQRGRFS